MTFEAPTTREDMTRLVLKRGKLSRSSGQWKDEDYDVLGRHRCRRPSARRS
jgi:hypothetical protein